jgi:hypothetical protein
MNPIDYKSTCESLRADLRSERANGDFIRKQLVTLRDELAALKAYNADGILVLSDEQARQVDIIKRLAKEYPGCS